VYKFDKLFTPYKIGNCEIPNRIVVTAMVANYCTADGMATERYIAYHEEKAKGGYGLIITEDYAVNEHAMGYRYISGFWNDDQVESHKKLTERIHKYDTKIFCQIYHAGRQQHAGVNGGVQPVAPSRIPCPWMRDMPRELPISEIKEIVGQFGDAALRAKIADFDGVEIHAGNGYLIAGFLSPLSNKRTDRYGGCFVNRVRFLKEIYDDIRAKVGNDFPVIIRFSADEHTVGGRDLSESRMLAKMVEQWGMDAINCSNGVYGTYNLGQVAPMYMPHAWTIENAAELKAVVSIPVIGVNRINDPLMADNLLAMGKADFIGISRGSLADPALPNKAKNGDFESIRYCIGCLQGCVGSLYPGDPIKCLVNPELGHEYMLDFSKPEQPKKVLVAGGGIAGMEAARAAAKKGHHVELYCSDSYLGGQFVSAAFPPGKGELTTYTSWLIREIGILGVKTFLNTPVTADLVKDKNPDRVIIATGAKPLTPPIPGIDKPIVLLAQDVLLGNVTVNENIVIAGGGEVGVETAAHLAFEEKGHICVVEMLDKIAHGMDGVNRLHILGMMQRHGVEARTSTKIIEICDDGVKVEKGGVEEFLPCDQVILALGYIPNNALVEELSFWGDKITVVGDAVKVMNAMAASQTGFEAGYNA